MQIFVTKLAATSSYIANPRYDSGRTHPYHPICARLFSVRCERSGERLRIPFRRLLSDQKQYLNPDLSARTRLRVRGRNGIKNPYFRLSVVEHPFEKHTAQI